MTGKKGFVLYVDYWEHLQYLSDEQAGKLLKAIFQYVKTGDIGKLDGAEIIAFSFIRAQLDRDSEKYDAKCEKNRVNGARGGRPPKANETENNPNKPNGYFEKPKVNPKNPIQIKDIRYRQRIQIQILIKELRLLVTQARPQKFHPKALTSFGTCILARSRNRML